MKKLLVVTALSAVLMLGSVMAGCSAKVAVKDPHDHDHDNNHRDLIHFVVSQ